MTKKHGKLVEERRRWIEEDGDVPTVPTHLGLPGGEIRAPLPHELFLDLDNDGLPVLTDAELDALEAAGFTNRGKPWTGTPGAGPDEPGEFYFRPDQWSVGPTEPLPCAGGYDLRAHPLTEEARAWGEDNFGNWHGD